MIPTRGRLAALVAEGGALLEKSGSPTPELESQLLLAHVLGTERSKMLVDPPDEIPADAPGCFRGLLERRAAGEPLFYITGSKGFHNHVFNVNSSVLVPRPETEEMVEAVLERFSNERPLAVADVGTGSGCIAVTLGLERPSWRIKAVDVSEDALSVARENARRLGAANVSFARSDLLSGVRGLFDVVVSNPPYVDFALSGALQVEVRKYEPSVALFADENGLGGIRELVAQSARRLRTGGTFFCEIGFDQKDAVSKFFDPAVWSDVEFIRDLAGHDRVATADKK
ncbi:MAG: peptide chain release factor N(5)-glutamine methyltransferase [Nitrospinae bacterium]|nr:peptide chain release factor N(5)-glutamine methyltransferase [Nitrospinota bacterium]